MNERIKQLVMKSGAGHRAGISGHVFDAAALEKFVKLLLEEAVYEIEAVGNKASNDIPREITDLFMSRVRAIDDAPPPKPKKPSTKKPKKAKPLKIAPPQGTTQVTTKSTSPGSWSNLFAFSTLVGISLM